MKEWMKGSKKIGRIRVDVSARINPETNEIEVRLEPKGFDAPWEP